MSQQQQQDVASDKEAGKEVVVVSKSDEQQQQQSKALDTESSNMDSVSHAVLELAASMSKADFPTVLKQVPNTRAVIRHEDAKLPTMQMMRNVIDRAERDAQMGHQSPLTWATHAATLRRLLRVHDTAQQALRKSSAPSSSSATASLPGSEQAGPVAATAGSSIEAVATTPSVQHFWRENFGSAAQVRWGHFREKFEDNYGRLQDGQADAMRLAVTGAQSAEDAETVSLYDCQVFGSKHGVYGAWMDHESRLKDKVMTMTDADLRIKRQVEQLIARKAIVHDPGDADRDSDGGERRDGSRHGSQHHHHHHHHLLSQQQPRTEEAEHRRLSGSGTSDTDVRGSKPSSDDAAALARIEEGQASTPHSGAETVGRRQRHVVPRLGNSPSASPSPRRHHHRRSRSDSQSSPSTPKRRGIDSATVDPRTHSALAHGHQHTTKATLMAIIYRYGSLDPRGMLLFQDQDSVETLITERLQQSGVLSTTPPGTLLSVYVRARNKDIPLSPWLLDKHAHEVFSEERGISLTSADTGNVRIRNTGDRLWLIELKPPVNDW